MDDDGLRLERAKLAMEEFKMLNAEILQRNTVLMQIVAGGMAAIVALIGFGAVGRLSFCLQFFLIALVLLFISGSWLMVHVDASKASSRIIEIETYVRECVGGDEKNPLSWQGRLGIDQRGYWDRLVEISQLLFRSVRK
jgi:hypothetical protein